MSTGEDPQQERARDDRGECRPCRGTGKLISGKGGAPHGVTCPWCGGTGVFDPERDAQAHAPAPTDA